MINAIAIDDEPLALSLIASLCQKSENVNLQASFTKPSEAKQFLENNAVDLIFCDIQMPNILGTHFIQQLAYQPLVIFTTAHSEYAAESYELNAVDYLLKPINIQRFLQAIEKAEIRMSHIQKDTQNYLFIKADFSLQKIALYEILYIESMADYLKIHLQNHKKIVVRMTMKKILELLPIHLFIRVHKSYIIPISKITAITGHKLSIQDKTIPIGKTYIKEFTESYKHFRENK